MRMLFLAGCHVLGSEHQLLGSACSDVVEDRLGREPSDRLARRARVPCARSQAGVEHGRDGVLILHLGQPPGLRHRGVNPVVADVAPARRLRRRCSGRRSGRRAGDRPGASREREHQRGQGTSSHGYRYKHVPRPLNRPAESSAPVEIADHRHPQWRRGNGAFELPIYLTRLRSLTAPATGPAASRRRRRSPRRRWAGAC